MTEWDAGRTQKEILALRAEVNELKAADFAVAGAIQEIRAKVGDLEKRLTTAAEEPATREDIDGTIFNVRQKKTSTLRADSDGGE